MMPFGETILAWRLARGMTQARLALSARIARPNLSAIERGEHDVTLKTLRALALALNVEPGVLVDGIAPGAAAPAMGRAILERVAWAAARNDVLPDARQSTLASQIRDATSARRSASRRADGPRPRSSGPRAADRAYFLLKVTETPGTLASLIDRVSHAGHRDRP